MKKIISLTMILTLLLGVMAGCKTPNSESGAVADPQQSVDPSVEQPSDQPTDDPIVGEPMDTPLAVQDLTADVAYTEEFLMMPPDDAFIQGQMDFSMDLFRQITQKTRCKNTLIAPLSVSMALAMTANGAEGQTLEEMQKVLGNQPIDKLNGYYMNWRMALQGGEKTKLRIANSIWIRDLQGFEAKDAFLASNAKYYDSRVFKAPFNSIGEKAINEWVEEKTDQMIPQLIEELRPETMMVLINALSFDAQWADPYTKHRVTDGIFHSIDGKKQKAKMMNSTEYSYLEGEGAIGFTRNYAGGRYAFGTLLPTEKSLEEYVSTLDGETLLKILKKKQTTQVHAQLPKFSSKFKMSMNEALKAMGMPSAFVGGFGKMSNAELFIGNVLHEAVIEVTEDGTRAAAATAVEMDKSAAPMEEPKVVTLDRPFVYFIFDRETNLPIFIGTLTSL